MSDLISECNNNTSRVEVDGDSIDSEKVIISDKEKTIIDYLINNIDKNKYIVEKNISIKGYSKALIQKTIRNEEIMNNFKLARVRTTKEIKERLGIDIGSYPFIICKNGVQ